ncbi:hypothetical protein C9374_004099 [Naegleria lovaniensis]|uniref:N-acetyltransferase domain-containing protein n=1 Tax=Naegleria lovaniensis TaxID=51637 RepID=A0AA88GSM8_NAELO|nr:uncharacterized protein C9374_004099 [Naegleria lovaniensis]KAG2383428.1 hypothetical protein C9374_004099 [Naegleria lovaniensis]
MSQVSIVTFSEAVQKSLSNSDDTLNVFSSSSTSSNVPRQSIEKNLQQEIHEIFTNGMWDCAPKKILNSRRPFSSLFGLLFNSDQGSTSESMVALFHDYFGYQLTVVIWSVLFMTWWSVGKILGYSLLQVTLLRILTFMGSVMMWMCMLYLILDKILSPMLMKDFSKYIRKSKESNELGDVAHYYENNSKKPMNRFFLAYIGEELVGHVAIDEWHYPGEGEDQVFRQLHEEFAQQQHNRPPIIAELRRMSVKSSHRGAGIAKKLINHLYEYVKNECHADYLVLKTSSLQYGARKLYSNFGFELKRVDTMIPPVALFHFVLDLGKRK